MKKEFDGRAESLAKKLMECKDEYYNGVPSLSDVEYDKIEVELRELNPEHPALWYVGASSKVSKKAEHKIKMGSLAKATDTDELKKWFSKFPKGSQVLIMSKLDGLSLELIYKDGKFVQAITRGDGLEGEDITNKLKFDFPKEINFQGDISVRGEVIYPKDIPDEIKDKYSNLRNGASGALRKGDEDSKYLTFMAFDIIGEDSKTHYEKLKELKQSKFRVIFAKRTNSLKVLQGLIEQEFKIREQKLFEVDGVVIRVDDEKLYNEVSKTWQRPEGAIAVKPEADIQKSILNGVKWQLGRTGIITPVAEIEPTEIMGVVVRNISLCNLDEIERLDIAIGDEIIISRRGDVIPKIERVFAIGKKRKKIKVPEICPECGEQEILQDGAFIKCMNMNCSGTMKSKILYWCNKNKMMGFGPAIVESFIESGHTIEDLYKFTMEDFANLELVSGRNLGEKTAKKLMYELQKTRSMSLQNFLVGIGMPNIGETLLDEFNLVNILNSKEFFMKLESGAFNSIVGVGDTIVKKASDWYKKSKRYVETLESVLEIIPDSPREKIEYEIRKLSGLSFCFTGKGTMPRNELFQLVKDNGGYVNKSLKTTTDILVCNPSLSGSLSSKEKKATKQGTKILSEDEFLKMINK